MAGLGKRKIIAECRKGVELGLSRMPQFGHYQSINHSSSMADKSQKTALHR